MALVASLSLTPGCAKLHNKLHTHKHAGEEIAYVPFPAKSSHAGLASVSPQMPTMVNSTVSKQEPVAYSAPTFVQPPVSASQAPSISEPRTSPFAPESSRSATTDSEESKSPAVPAPVTIRPGTPTSSAPAPAAADVTPPVRTDIKPSAGETAKPASAPATKPSLAPEANLPPVDSKPPSIPELPSADKLPIDLPKDLPPPPASPNLSRNANLPGANSSGKVVLNPPVIPASPSPFGPLDSGSNGTPDRVITLSLPGSGLETGSASIPAPAEAQPNVPASKPTASEGTSEIAELSSILGKTRQTLANTSNYKVDVLLQERMNGRLLPQDKFTLYKRREPLAVRMEWTEGKDVGREVIYSPAETKGMIQIRMPKGLIPRISMSPDSPLVRSKSRHPISEAGADSVVDRLMATLQQFQSGNPAAGQLTVEPVVDPQLGNIRRVTHRTHDHEIWVVDLEENSGLPLTIHATDDSGELLEHYEFRGYQLNSPELLTAEAFDYNARWGNQKLFGRLANGNSKDTETKR